MFRSAKLGREAARYDRSASQWRVEYDSATNNTASVLTLDTEIDKIL